ncbi:efflux RND transporter periplasmic adaptor subunit [Paraflavitalea sp. CAU 1676]|uniref:efflux RND transporter periplasmic adaptor subunit n=1 Tax=Paraflavitalea sp. CAU 1676 TaxID=3032598 RepID=UPI0023DAB1AF|nr:efflux RND transporter periplasmic adaptor subunit [Paraflavitalea sp. CAU 1676]MDF2193509.1 efflux RND transporter periplasmic adaptor subunit [Paraflavitalea sp. CAU 1676]
MNSRNIIYCTLVLFISITLLGCGGQATPPAAPTAAPADEDLVTLSAEQVTNSRLQTGQLSRQAMSGTLRLSGQIDVPPQNLMSISTPLGGYLKTTNMLPGTHVQKGQLLAVMEDPQYIQLQQDYLLVRNKLNYAQKEYDRQRELNSSKASSDKVLQQAESEYRNLSIESKALAAKLSLLAINAERLTENNISKTINIHSPISGYISKVNVNIGKYVTPSDVIFELVNPADIHLNLTVYEKDLAQLEIGQQALAFTNARPNERYETKIILVSHSLNENRSTEVHCHFERYDKSLVPGMFMNAEIRLRDREENVLPDAAIVNFENKDYIFVQEAERSYRLTPVEKGATANGATVVVSKGLEGKTIVTTGAYSLLMHLKNKAE